MNLLKERMRNIEKQLNQKGETHSRQGKGFK